MCAALLNKCINEWNGMKKMTITDAHLHRLITVSMHELVCFHVLMHFIRAVRSLRDTCNFVFNAAYIQCWIISTKYGDSFFQAALSMKPLGFLSHCRGLLRMLTAHLGMTQSETSRFLLWGSWSRHAEVSVIAQCKQSSLMQESSTPSENFFGPNWF